MRNPASDGEFSTIPVVSGRAGRPAEIMENGPFSTREALRRPKTQLFVVLAVSVTSGVIPVPSASGASAGIVKAQAETPRWPLLASPFRGSRPWRITEDEPAAAGC
jgi:hypothetical protein